MNWIKRLYRKLLRKRLTKSFYATGDSLTGDQQLSMVYKGKDEKGMAIVEITVGTKPEVE